MDTCGLRITMRRSRVHVLSLTRAHCCHLLLFSIELRSPSGARRLRWTTGGQLYVMPCQRLSRRSQGEASGGPCGRGDQYLEACVVLTIAVAPASSSPLWGRRDAVLPLPLVDVAVAESPKALVALYLSDQGAAPCQAPERARQPPGRPRRTAGHREGERRRARRGASTPPSAMLTAC